MDCFPDRIQPAGSFETCRGLVSCELNDKTFSYLKRVAFEIIQRLVSIATFSRQNITIEMEELILQV